MTHSSALFESHIKSLPLLHRGKVRDIYTVDTDKLLIIQTDRLSAFDVILPTAVPGKESCSQLYLIFGLKNWRISFPIT